MARVFLNPIQILSPLDPEPKPVPVNYTERT